MKDTSLKVPSGTYGIVFDECQDGHFNAGVVWEACGDVRKAQSAYEDALRATADEALKQQTGARGLRTILESVLLDTMYELPSMTSARKVVVDEAVILGDGGARHTEIVRLLLAHGADPALRDAQGVAALEHAERRGQSRHHHGEHGHRLGE